MFIADLHVHSRFSRATSRKCDPEHFHYWAQRKGITVVGTGDFTHPGYLAELEEKLIPAEEGLYALRPERAAALEEEVPASCRGPVRFLLSAEISSIYKKGGRVRKVHNVIFAPGLEVARNLGAALARIGNVESDGRPILGLDSKDLLEIVLSASEQAFLVPAHIWTPWFSVLGSKSGFDSIEECFEELTPHIFAVETGLSSDPPMNWGVSSLDRYTLISNSDAHSPEKLGREANRFTCPLSFPDMRDALRRRGGGEGEGGFAGTVEFFPEEGKYHYDGHRKCQVRLTPEESAELDNKCPVCGKAVTVGVMNRVRALADREMGSKPEGAAPYSSLLSLKTILGELLEVGPGSLKVGRAYDELNAELGPELAILEARPLEDMGKVGPALLPEAIGRMRDGKVKSLAGYDGEFGTIRLFEEGELSRLSSQMNLFSPPDRKTVPKHPSPPKPSKGAPALGADDSDGTAPALPGLDAGGDLNIRQWEEASSPILEGLNDEQRRACEVIEGPLIITAGPGTGKTRTLTHRIAYLILECAVAPEQVLALTFTNKAAEEMYERLAHLLGPAVSAGLSVMTLHAFGLMVLKAEAFRLGLNPGFALYGREDQLELLRQLALDAVVPEWGARAGPTPRDLRQWLERLSRAKVDGRVDDEVAPLLEAYQASLEIHQAVDLDDLILLCAKLFERHPGILDSYLTRYRHISVDEYQDLNRAQYRLLRLLAPGEANLCVIGDPDQSIYGFRGADSRFFLKFKSDYPRAVQVSLARNYRSSETILSASSQVISHNQGRLEVRIFAQKGGGPRLRIARAATERAEGEYVVQEIEHYLGGMSHFALDSGRVSSDEAGAGTFSDIAVLFRLGAQSAPLEEAIGRAGIPYQRMGDRPFNARTEVRRMISLLRILQNQGRDDDVLRLAGSLPGLGAQGLECFKTHCAHSGQGLAQGLLEADRLPGLSGSGRRALGELARSLALLRDQVGVTEVAALIEQAEKRVPVKGKAARGEGLLRRQRLHRELLRRALPFGRNLDRFLLRMMLGHPGDDYHPRSERITLATFHAAKGLEFPLVFLTGCEEGLLPFLKDGEAAAHIEEERRLFYVGMTRARRLLYLTHARSRFIFGQRIEARRSRFLNHIEAQLLRQQARRASRRRESRDNGQLSLF